MLQKQIEQLREALNQGDYEAIHSQISSLRINDQKSAKMMVANYLADFRKCPVAQSMRVYVGLQLQKTNLYYNAFALLCPKLGAQPQFWENLPLLQPLGELYGQNKVFYRQNVVRALIHGISTEYPVLQLFQVLNITDPRAQMVYLVEPDSIYAMYLLLKVASQNEVDTAFITQCIKQFWTNSKSEIPVHQRESVVNFMNQYFNDVHVHHLNVQELLPAQLAYAEKSFDAFCKVIIPAKRIGL